MKLNYAATTALLFFVIIVEGYVVLSSEILAIRMSTPFVGNGTDTVSIIIAAVLMPLAFGYYAGGHFQPGIQPHGRRVTVRQRLIRNLLIGSAFIVAGTSHLTLNVFFASAIQAGLDNRILLTAIYSILFLVTPVYLLGQTIPLVSNFFSRERLSKFAGRILFVSTIGSFLGAVFSTLVLMAFIGVHYTSALNPVLLAVLVIVLAHRRQKDKVRLSIALAFAGILLNAGPLLSSMGIVSNNIYNTIVVRQAEDGARQLMLNYNLSSRYHPRTGDKADYIDYIEKHYIDTAPVDKKLEILVLGAGGFTLGLKDSRNIYHFVDIDKDLKEVSEKHFLKQELGPNKHFHPLPARSWLTRDAERYDLIVLDTYTGGLILPEHLGTAEYFQQVRKHLKPSGVMIANMAMSPTFETEFSRNLDATIRTVFPFVTRQIIGDYNGWGHPENAKGDGRQNVLYIYHNHKHSGEEPEIYSDLYNRMFLHRPQNR